MARKLLFVGVPVLVVLALVAWNLRSAIPVQTMAVLRGEVQEYVDEQGKTQLPRTHEISMPFAGRIEAITLREGDLVQPGQLVARIVPHDLDDEVAEAQAVVEQLAARILENDDVSVERSAKQQADLFVESMKSTVAAAAARQTAAKSQLDYSETFLGRVRSLIPTGASTLDQLDQAEMSYIQSQVDYRQDVLTTEALQAIQAATDLLPTMILDYIGRRLLSHNVLLQERAEADARLRQALQRQQRSAMRSPIDGVVLERIATNEQFQAAGMVVLRLGQLDQLEVVTDLLSEDVGRVRVGNRVVIYGPAIGAEVEQGVSGVVQRIYPAGFTKLSSLGVEQQRVTVVVRFADGVLPGLLADHRLGVDYRVRVRILTNQVSGALLAPRSSLFRGPQGTWQVFAVRARRAVLQDIQVGLMNDAVAEVTSGLTESDRVILAPDSEVRNGARVSFE